MVKGDDIEERLIDFAVRIINISTHLPITVARNHIGNQILRSGTAPAVHYAEARSSESDRDFVHKLRIGLKELSETRIWLKIITRSNMQPETRLEAISQEGDELCRILSTSIKTTQKRIQTKRDET